jgi:hypothetical protein
MLHRFSDPLGRELREYQLGDLRVKLIDPGGGLRSAD